MIFTSPSPRRAGFLWVFSSSLTFFSFDVISVPWRGHFFIIFLSFLSIFFLPKLYVVIIIPIRLSHSSFTRPCTINIEDMRFLQIMTRCAEICQFYLPHSNFVVSIYHIQNLSFLLTAFKICCLPHSKTALVLRDWQPPGQLQVLQPRLKIWNVLCKNRIKRRWKIALKSSGVTFYLGEVGEEVAVLQGVLLEGLGEVPDVVVDDDDYWWR